MSNKIGHIHTDHNYLSAKYAEAGSVVGGNPFADLPEISGESQVWRKENDELKQQSKEWFLHRWDKFTGSEIPNLMKRGKANAKQGITPEMAKWGETAKAVILKKVAYAQMTDEGREMQAEIEMSADFKQTRWGNTYEPEARANYAEFTGLNVREVGFMVNPECAYNGGSFDGEIEDVENEIYGIIEIKCPYDPIKHSKNASLKIDGLDQSHEYYAQIQNNINVAGVDWCDFISYDPRRKSEHQLVVIRVMRDDFFIEGMMDRIHKAERIKQLVLMGNSIDSACFEVEVA